MPAPFDPGYGTLDANSPTEDLPDHLNNIRAMLAGVGEGNTYVPTWTGITGGTPIGYYVDLGLICWFYAGYTWSGDAPTLGTGTITTTTPTAIVGSRSGDAQGRFLASDGSEDLWYPLFGSYGTSGSSQVVTLRAPRASDGAYVNLGNAGAGGLALADGGWIQVSGFYRKAS